MHKRMAGQLATEQQDSGLIDTVAFNTTERTSMPYLMATALFSVCITTVTYSCEQVVQCWMSDRREISRGTGHVER